MSDSTHPPGLRLTEQDLPGGQALHELGTLGLLQQMNEQDATVAGAVASALPAVAALVEAVVPRMQRGGRLFYVGAGTSGRLGVLDAAECPPTFGVPQGLVVGIIAGGDPALRQAVEGAEDDAEQGWRDVQTHQPQPDDTLLGLSASGRTPYALGAVQGARLAGLLTGCVVQNPASELAAAVQYPIEVITGPEFITGSTRLKAGTALKLVLNMITTALFVRMGRVEGRRMVDMMLTNEKLIDRGTLYVTQATGLPHAQAQALLLAHGSVRGALTHFRCDDSEKQ